MNIEQRTSNTEHRTARVSVVIPVLNAGRYLPALFDALFSQEPEPPSEVILVDSMSTDNTRYLAENRDHVRVVPIENFSHGRARNLGAREAAGDVVVLMTQDALPKGVGWLGALLEPLREEGVGAVFSRQEPWPDASPMETFFLESHFPPGAPVTRRKDGPKPLRFKDQVFFSNVSAAIPRDLLLKHPFDETLIMSEDQQFARDLLEAGYATVYEPASVVMHSHTYSLIDVFKRYFDSVYSLTQIFPQHGMRSSATMGLSYLGRECAHITRRYPAKLPHYFLYTMAKTSGTIAGHFAEKMPGAWRKKLSLHSYHWN